jgi:hypothetical protein
MYGVVEVGRVYEVINCWIKKVKEQLIWIQASSSAHTRIAAFHCLIIWCITIDHPDDWIVVMCIVVTIWIHLLKPRYVVIGAAKILNMALHGFFDTVFVEDLETLQA